MKVSDIFLFANLIITTKSLDFTLLSYGKYLNAPVYTRLDGIGLYGCARACGATNDCKSFCFHVSTLRCSLFRVNASLAQSISTPGYIYGDRETVMKDAKLMGPCADHACPDHSTCIVLRSLQTVCIVSGCGVPPNLPRTTDVPHSNIAVGDDYTYTCSSDHSMTGGPAALTCLPQGTWSTATFDCIDDD